MFEIVNPIVWKEFEADKLSILDILAIDNSDRRLNVEVQRTKPASLAQRLAYYSATQLAEYHSEFRLRTRSGLELTNCLEIHLLELPKYSPVDDNESIADPRDQWMYFFRRAEGSTVEELLDRLPDPVFQRAVGVLEMISRTPEQRRHYDARLKWELDENTRIQTAFEEGEIKGREEGREEGELFGKVRMLQNLLSLPQLTDEELHPKSRTELETLVTQLQAQLRKRMT